MYVPASRLMSMDVNQGSFLGYLDLQWIVTLQLLFLSYLMLMVRPFRT